MSLYSPAAQVALKQPSVLVTIGVKFYFDDGPQYYLRSSEPRRDPDGIVWKAGSAIVNIDGLQFGVGRRTQPVSLVMNGLPKAMLDAELSVVTEESFYAFALAQAQEARGRRIEFFQHHFNADWSYIEPPTSLGLYVMDRLTPAFDGEAQTASIKLTAEPLSISKFRAPNMYLDRRDQRARHPGDGGLDFVPRYVVNQSLPPW